MARRLLCAIDMRRARSRTIARQLRFIGFSLFGLGTSLAAAIYLLKATGGYGRLFLSLGLFVVALRYFRSLARTAWRVREVRTFEAALQDTGRALEKLHGYELLRRLVGVPGKQEHVVVGPNGIFVVITRPARHCPSSPGSKANRRDLARNPDPVEESRIEAACVAEKIHQRLGHRPKVQPVLCFPQALVAVGEKRRGVMIVTTPTVAEAIQAQPKQPALPTDAIEAVVEALVEPLPVALPPSPPYLRLMPRPLPRR